MVAKRRDSKGRVLRNGESQRADGMYMYRYTDSVGKRQTVYSWKLVETDGVPSGKRCGASLREIEKEILRDLQDGLRVAEANNITVDDMFAKFLEVRIDLKETTRCNYICLYDKHLRPTVGEKKVKKIKYSDVQKLYVDFAESGLKISTIRSVHSIFTQILELAVRDDLIRGNPAMKALRDLQRVYNGEQEKRHALTEEQQSRLIDYIYNSPRYQRWGVLVTVLLGTGMRIGEALGLRWCDCDFVQNIITVDHTLLYKQTEDKTGYVYRISEPKTKAGKRTIPMFLAVRGALSKEKERRRNMKSTFSVEGYCDFVFLNSNDRVFTPAAVFEMLQSVVCDYNRDEAFAAKKEGREPCFLPKISPHILRHTFCTRMCENESNIKLIQDVMGHKNIHTRTFTRQWMYITRQLRRKRRKASKMLRVNSVWLENLVL